jgi:hypothetical protein
VLLCVLIFTAGVLIGYQWGLGQPNSTIARIELPIVSDTAKKVIKPLLQKTLPDSMVRVYHYTQNSFALEKDTMITMGISKLRPTYCVQLGAFTDKKRALNRVSELHDKGLTAYIFEGKSPKGTQWYMVRIGIFTDKKLADKAAFHSENMYKIQSLGRPYNVF